jgi:L-ribulose-5-phosphate 4-epimerase
MDEYEHETGVQIVQIFRDIAYEETPLILVGGYGPFTWEGSPEEVVYNSVMLEEIATMAYLTCAISPKMDALRQVLIDKHFYRKRGKEAYYGQQVEKD